MRYTGNQILGLSHYLTLDSLIHHGYNYYQGHLSCCVWARGNGWAILAMTEFLQAKYFSKPIINDKELLQVARETGFDDDIMINDVKNLFRSQIGQLLDIQTPGGLWPNILTNNQTFLETSSSAMFLTGTKDWVSSQLLLLLLVLNP